MSLARARLSHVDALKAVAAQFIVLHHLVSYGPLAEAAQAHFEAVATWLQHHGRMAVQVFLVVGGFLAARMLSRHGGLLVGSLPALLAQRHRRLAWPFMAAVLLTLAISALVAPLLPELATPFTAAQLLGHALLLHGLLGQESLTVGAWYVAIDFLLFATLAALLWLTRRLPGSRLPRLAGPLAVAALTLASLFVFNRDSQWDHLPLYFFGAYGPGRAGVRPWV